ncbi:SAM-dependent methyltransferase [Planotetraspora sp. A-T 1434]|uniref:SAM-dependent methyltransferase n=1 Tax=Planotetraspora sp. A-T 1434 TaxID=2979219 RepID=UPI0021BF7273|nr:SAM-dependent methyltransferase [Planotetraspora sp. A-T 1434]MCT9935362.1 SAM-dependent methyltransferase [Planotetraspora sp. A-T 1434]
MAEDATAPPGIDVHIPNAARMYNYYLGGKDNFPVDREAAERVLAVAPEARELARQNRAFMRRAVRYLVAEAGIRQFLDIGTGLPTEGNVHEVAAEVDPGTRVAYVDNDPVVLAHARALLSSTTNTLAVPGDLRQPQDILDDSELRSLIDFTEPVGILLVAVLHFLTDSDKPAELIARLRDAVPPGSYLVLSHVTAEDHTAAAQKGAAVYRRANASITLRTRTQITEMFEGFEVLDPGVVRLDEWHPDHEASIAGGRDLPTWFLCGVGRAL